MSHSSAPNPTTAPLPPLRPGPHTRRLDTITVVATMGGLLFGYDTGVINGALEPMKEQLGLSASGEGAVTSSLLVGAAIGSLLCGRLNDSLGRKKSLTILATLFFVATLGCVFAPSLAVMIPARFALGFAVGGASVTVPVYLAELAPTERRGALAGRNELAIVIGAALAFVVNAIIASVWGHHDNVWRYMLAVCALPAIFLFVGMLRMPESPRWLLSKGRHGEAFEVLKQVRTEDRARAELAEVEHLAEEEAEAHLGGWKDLNLAWVRRLLIAGVGLAIAQQCTGINSVMYYGTQLLQNAGFGGQAAIVANILPGVSSVIGSIICLFWLIDRVPRRTLIIAGIIATTTCHLLLMLASALLSDGMGKAYTILALLVAFTFCMQTALNVTVWVCLSELFPLRLRGFGMGICVLMLWLSNAVIAYIVPIVVEALGITGLFTFFFAVGVFWLIFLSKLLPNTSGRSLEELEDAFAAGNFR